MTEQQYIIAKEIFINNNGKSISWVAEQSGVNRKKLSKRLKEDGLYKGRFQTQEIFDEAVKMLNNGIGITQVAKNLGVSRTNLSRNLSNRGLYEEKYNKDRSRYETKEMMSMIEDYKNDMSKSNIMSKYNISKEFMYNALRFNNVKLKGSGRTYIFSDDIFENIDSEDKAYWLGFLYADGYVSETLSILELSLAVIDLNHVEKFASFINTKAPISTRDINLNGKLFKACRISVCSKKIVNDLVSHGCVQAKSLVLTFPNIREDLVNHFIRGYFDGDGSVSISNGQLSFSIIGTENFLDTCVEKMSLHHNKKSMNGKAYSINYHGNNLVKKIYNYLYKDATVYLERKREKFLAVLGRDI